jgi:hypothetical protein
MITLLEHRGSLMTERAGVEKLNRLSEATRIVRDGPP